MGVGEHDQRAGTDAFELLDLVIERRLRPLLTVVDPLGLDAARRVTYVSRAGVAASVVMAFVATGSVLPR